MSYYCPPKQRHWITSCSSIVEQLDVFSPKEIIGITADSPGKLVERERRWGREVRVSLVSKQDTSPLLVPFSLLPWNSEWLVSATPTPTHKQWDRYRIFRSGPRVPGCYNGEIQSFYAESGPFPDHFWNFSGLLVVILQFIALEYKLLFLARRIFVHSIDIRHFKVIVKVKV